MQPQIKVWVEEGGRTLFSDHEVALLEAIARNGTLTETAASLGLSYRRAWGKIKEAEAKLGTKLVESTVGGSGGGSTHLTPAAESLVALFSGFRGSLGSFAEQEFATCLRGLNEICGTQSEVSA